MISEGERARRYLRLREEMEKAGHEVLLVAGREGAVGRGAVRYLSDWHIWGGTGYIVVPLRGEPSLILGSNSQAMWAKRIGWLEDALSPLRGRIPAEELQRLVLAIRATLGIEALIWLTDVAGVSREQAVDILRASARTLLRAALADAAPPRE